MLTKPRALCVDDLGSRLAMTPKEVWTSQCEVAREILEDSGIENALSYLIGEKLLNFLQVAEDYPAWRDEIPNFVAEIKDLLAGWQIAEYLSTLCRPGAMASVGGEGTYPSFRVLPVDELDLRQDAPDRALLEWARELLLDDDY